MATFRWSPGPYTIAKLGREMLTHLPELAQWGPHLRPPKDDGLEWSTRLAVQLRLARLLGCPVCLKLFPGLGPRAGLTDDQVKDALAGDLHDLPPEAAGAVAWMEAVLAGGGTAPVEVPEAALVLRASQRDHLLATTRLEIVIHSIGLMFLPHSMIERAFAG
jgi:alkylhydroperoxidase family enzyme